MTQEEHVREQRQALNAAINNRDLETIKSYLHPAYVGKMGRRASIDKQAMVRQMERMLKRVKDFDSQVEVEDIEVSGDSAKLVVRRIGGGTNT